jgi:hypothetical protein
MNHTVVAFEVDAIEPLSHAGWSVMVTGHASVIDDPEHIADAERLPLLGWAISGPHSYVRIEGEVITGRRLDPIMRASVHSFSGGGQRTCPGCAGAIIATSDGEDTNFFCPSCGRCWHVEMGFVSSVDPGTCPGCRFHQVCEAVSP